DLGKVLAGRKLSTGTHVVVWGSGARVSSPIVVKNAWIRLSFEQADGPPLVLSPRTAETGRSGEAGRNDAFISVTNGGVEIANAAFTATASERAPLPRWFIQVVDGDLALRNSRIQGPLTGTTRNKGLISWMRGDGRITGRPFSGPYDAYALIESSYLYGAGI